MRHIFIATFSLVPLFTCTQHNSNSECSSEGKYNSRRRKSRTSSCCSSRSIPKFGKLVEPSRWLRTFLQRSYIPTSASKLPPVFVKNYLVYVCVLYVVNNMHEFWWYSRELLRVKSGDLRVYQHFPPYSWISNSFKV